MKSIAEISVDKRGKKIISFSSLGVYDLLKEEFGFRYFIINRKGYFLKFVNGFYDVVNFFELCDAFVSFARNNFDEFGLDVGFHDFINEYYRQSPIKNGSYIKTYLGEGFFLTDEQQHHVLLKIDYKYANDFEQSETVRYLVGHGFVKDDNKKNYFLKGSVLYYKKVRYGKYIVVSMLSFRREYTTFEVFGVDAMSENDFLLKENDNIKSIIQDLDLNKDRHVLKALISGN